MKVNPSCNLQIDYSGMTGERSTSVLVISLNLVRLNSYALQKTELSVNLL